MDGIHTAFDSTGGEVTADYVKRVLIDPDALTVPAQPDGLRVDARLDFLSVK